MRPSWTTYSDGYIPFWAFPPSLAPAATWNGILSDLKDRSDIDMALSIEQAAHVRAYLDEPSIPQRLYSLGD